MTESNGELQFVTPEELSLAMNEKDILKVVQKIAGRPMRIKIDAGKAGRSASGAGCQRPETKSAERALAHPEVQAVSGTVPGRQVRVVRNLKE